MCEEGGMLSPRGGGEEEVRVSSRAFPVAHTQHGRQASCDGSANAARAVGLHEPCRQATAVGALLTRAA